MNAVLESTVELDRFRSDVIAGLGHPRKRLSAKYFYDAAGSRLFDRICALDEYYPTRTELGIMRHHAREMAERCGPHCTLVEFGAGSLTKIRSLLGYLDRPAEYLPVDVSGEHLEAAARALSAEFPELDAHPICADFTQPFELPRHSAGKRVVYFPGSTLGNFGPEEADRLLRGIAELVRPGGGLLLGIDLRKDERVLEAAYNDRLGVTAAFNRNLLHRINRELGADFDPDAFRHHAFYNRLRSRIEMHLVSDCHQTVRIDHVRFRFRRGESIHTENSHKYDLAEFSRRAEACGLRADATWTDPLRYFAVLYLTAIA